MIDLSKTQVTVFGGSGFVGRYVVQRLARCGARIRVAVRRPEKALFLKPLGATGQIQVVQANVRAPASVAAALEQTDSVVNLVGILAPSGKQTFSAVQSEGAANIARAAKAGGVSRMVHLSAIGADPESDSDYARTKAEGERAAGEEFSKTTILRPSLIFGPEDAFFNRFAAMARLLPVMPLIAGETRFQPVYVGDVAEAVVAVLDAARKGKSKGKGKLYELGGPRVYTFRELLEIVMDEAMIRRPFLPIPMPVARLQAAVTQFLPNPPLTPDQLRLLSRDNVVSGDVPGLEALGITPTPVEAILPAYMKRFRPKGQFSRRAPAA